MKTFFTAEKKRRKKNTKPAEDLQHGKSFYLDVIIHTETSECSILRKMIIITTITIT